MEEKMLYSEEGLYGGWNIFAGNVVYMVFYLPVTG